LQTRLRSFILCWDWSHTFLEKATAVRKLARDGVASKRSMTHAMLGLFCFKKPTRWLFTSIELS